MKRYKIILLVLQLFSFFNRHLICGVSKANGYVDLIAFSCDRPLQLYSLLESVEEHITGLHQISVIVRASNQEYLRAYEAVKRRFLHVEFFLQGKSFRKDFKPLVLKCLQLYSSDYVLFAVDDMIITDAVDIRQCVDLLEKTKAHGFFLRMGKNIQVSFHRKSMKVPPTKEIEKGTFEWRFSDGQLSYWRYPNTVDMTLYRKQDIIRRFKKMHFQSPNRLESVWRKKYLARDLKKTGLFFEHSKVINIPLNLVQADWSQWNMALYSTQELLAKFNEGLKIDIKKFFRINNNAAHMAYTPEFVVR